MARIRNIKPRFFVDEGKTSFDTHICPACRKKLVYKYFLQGKTKIMHFHRHHITPKRYGGGDADANKETICLWCHKEVHQFYTDRAIKMAVAADPNFFKTAFKDFCNQGGK